MWNTSLRLSHKDLHAFEVLKYIHVKLSHVTNIPVSLYESDAPETHKLSFYLHVPVCSLISDLNVYRRLKSHSKAYLRPSGSCNPMQFGKCQLISIWENTKVKVWVQSFCPDLGVTESVTVIYWDNWCKTIYTFGKSNPFFFFFSFFPISFRHLTFHSPDMLQYLQKYSEWLA